MANSYPNKVPFSYKHLTVQMADISSSGSCFLAVPFQGEFIGWRMSRSATTTGTAEITVELNGTAISSAAESAVAGTNQAVTSNDCTPTAVKDGDVLEFISDGGSTTASIGVFTAIFRE